MIKEKILKFIDKINLKEENFNDLEKIRGRVIFRDPVSNEVIMDKDNLIMLRSRTFLLELLFGLKPLNSNELGYTVNRNRKVCLFKIGSGGADIEVSPFSTIAPKFNQHDLNFPVPFITDDPNKEYDEEKRANPSYLKELTEEQKLMYYLPKRMPDESISYFGKVLEQNGMELRVNEETNETYVFLTMRIEASEARGKIINELGLVLAEYDEQNNSYVDDELFSMITFDSVTLQNLKRGIVIEYMIYA